MVAMATLTSVLTVGIAFYIRFIVALWRDSTRNWIGYLVRIEPDEGGGAMAEPQPEPESALREETPANLQCV